MLALFLPLAATVGLMLAIYVTLRLRNHRPNAGAPVAKPSLGLRRTARTPDRQPRPPEDEPPAGLLPLVPSPRLLAEEAARGIREMELYLAEETA